MNNQEVKDKLTVSYELRRMLIENDRDLDPLLNDVLPKDESELKQFSKEVKELRQYFKDSLIEE